MQNSSFITITFLSIFVLLFSGCRPLDYVKSAHTTANAISPESFDDILQRDLTSSFEARLNKTVKVKHELLVDSPGQSGIAFPKYYLWVSVYSDAGGETPIEEGPARVESISGSRFQVLDYVEKNKIEKDPRIIWDLFPYQATEKILKRVGFDQQKTQQLQNEFFQKRKRVLGL